MRISDWSSDVCSSDLETVQEVFTRLWERRETIEIHSSARYYLYRSCRNILYNLLEKKATRDALSLSRVEPVPEPAEDAAGQLSYKLLETDFREAVNELPEIGRAHVCTPVTNAP